MRVPDDNAPAWLNGRWMLAGQAGVQLSDPGLLAGLGVYETLAVHEGQCRELEEHLARLGSGAERLGVPLPGMDGLREAVGRIAGEAAGDRGWLKILATRGGNRAVFGGPVDPRDPGRPASAILLDWRRSPHDPLVGCKTLNYAPFVLGLEQARRQGADEAIWRNTRGHLAEGCASNLFIIRHRKLYTPAARDGILCGVTRALVLQAARRRGGLIVHEGKIRLQRLETAHEAFLTSSVLGLRPLVRFHGRNVGSGDPGPVSRAIAEDLERLRTERAAAAVTHSG